MHPYVFHLLSHRAVITIEVLIIKKSVGFERIFFIRFGSLFFIKIIILHLVFNIVLLQLLIVLFRSITGIGGDNFWCGMVLMFIKFCVFLQGGCVGSSLMERVV